MGFFEKKEKISIDKLNEIKTRLDNLSAKIDNHNLDLEKLKTHIASLRGLVNRRLGFTEPGENEKDLKEGVLALE